MKYLVSILLLFCGACGAHAPQAGETHASASLPVEVADFAHRRNGCEHFLGEDPYDAARAEEIRQQTTRLCTGTDAELARLKRVYANDPAVTGLLNRFEAKVE